MADAHATSRRRGTGRLGLVVAVVVVGATLSLTHAAADAATTTSAAVAGATLRDPANDVKAGDIDLTSIAAYAALYRRFATRGDGVISTSDAHHDERAATSVRSADVA